MELEIEGLDDLIEFIERMDGEKEPIINEALEVSGDYLKEKYSSGVYSHGLTRRSGDSAEAVTRTNPVNGSLYVGVKGGRKVKGYYLHMHEFGFWNVRAKRFIAPRPTFGTIYANEQNNILQKQAEVFKKRWIV